MGQLSSPHAPAERIERLEQICALLWSSEPPAEAHDRTRLFSKLGEVERRVTSLSLKLIVDAPAHDPLDEQMHEQMDQSLRRCERHLAELRTIWDLTDDELLPS